MQNNTKTEYIPVSLTKQVQSDYLDYSMAVLLGRAIPDLYDGLKPAQRRVLQTMLEEGLNPEKRYVKCARVTGLTMAYYHPHGGCYGTLVNMATSWNNNVPWIDGHGNFGSTVDGPAAERYTECRLRQSAVELLLQDKATWETRPNYDGSRQEAIRFNSAIPSVLLNGDTGIAVGFATKLAPHNLSEIVEVCKNMQKKSKKSTKLLPDFPTGCDIVQDEELEKYAQTGNGNIRCRAKVAMGEVGTGKRAKPTLTYSNLPPGTNPEKLGEQIKTALDKGILDGISEVRDDSDLDGDRITVIAKPNTNAATLSERLYGATDLDSRYSAKTLVIDGTTPVELSPITICQKWFTWRLARLANKFQLEYNQAELRHEIVTGLLKAISKIDLVIKVIRAAASPKEALIELVSNRSLKFTSEQARAILDMRLRALTNLDASELQSELENLQKTLQSLQELLSSEDARAKWAIKIMSTHEKAFGSPRRSQLIPAPAGTVTKKAVGSPATAGKTSRPRFMLVDAKKGLVSQAKGPRGALVLESSDKVILVTEDGTLKKVASNFKGAISNAYSPVKLAKKAGDILDKKYLLVFQLEEQVKATTLLGSDMMKVTSKGKSILPEDATMVHFGEDAYTVPWQSSRKKAVKLTTTTVKVGKPGNKGIKVATISEVAL